MPSRPTLVIPAAGFGSRFGGPLHKLAQPLDGSTVLGCTVQRALESRLPLVVVTTAALAPSVLQWVPMRDVVVLSGDEAARGMGASIAAGVAERSSASGWLVLPGDMPRVRSSSIVAVADALAGHAVAYAEYRGRRGHPVGFSAELYSELVLLNGDDGARRIAARYPAQARDVDDPGVLIDVDTANDLQALRRVQGEQRHAAT